MLGEYAPTWLLQMPWIASRFDRATLETRAIGATPERMLREMVDFVEGLAAAARPLVLVLEDLHWSDHSTIDLVTALARRSEPNHLLLVVTYRPQDAAAAGHPLHRVARELSLRGHAVELAAPPLSAEAVARYLEGRDVPASDAIAAALHTRTRGNPLFLEKVVDAWRDQGFDGEGAGADALLGRIPETLRELVEGQLLALGGDERDVLEAASVAGVEAAGAAVAAGCERDEEDVEAILERLAARAAFLEAIDEQAWPDGTLTGRYRFTHDICQEILYERLSRARRRSMHVRIGSRLEQGHAGRTPEVAAQLASHFTAGRDAPRAVRYHGLAAEQAFHRVAPRDALEHVVSGLALLDAVQPELRARAELGLRAIEGPARVAIHGWDDDAAEQAFLRGRELCEELGELEELQWALFKLATFYEVRAQYSRSEELVAESFALPVEGSRLGLLIDSHELMACSLLHQGSFVRSHEHAELVLRLDDGQYANPLTAAYGDNPGVAAHSWASLALWFMGHADQARDRALQSIALAEHPGRASARASAYAQAAAVAQLRREPDATLAWAEEAIRLAAGGGYRYREAMALLLRGWALVELERPDEGMEEAIRGLAQARATGVRMDEGYLLGVLADACLRAGRWEEGLRAIGEAQELRATQRSFFYEPELLRLRGELLARTGDTAGASEHLDRALAAAREGRSPALELRAAVSWATVLLAAGRGDEAIALLSRARSGVTEGAGTPDLRAADELLLRLSASPR
jgi:tetratricopeptide (TPR) repeat protein